MRNTFCCFTLILSVLTLGNGMQLDAQTWGKNDVLFSVADKKDRKGFIQSSIDGGKNWRIIWDGGLHARTRENRLMDIVYANKTLVAVGNTILTSKDGGETWKETVLKNYEKEQMFSTNKKLRAITFGGGFFVAVGPNHVLYSTNGKDWKYVRSGKLSEEEQRRKKAKVKGEYPPDLTENLMFPLDVVYVNGIFVVSGGSRDCVVALYSIFEDKLVLNKKSKLSKQYGQNAKLKSGGLKSTGFDGRTQLVSISNSRKFTISNDLGATWNFSYTPEHKIGAAILFANEQWIAVSKNGAIYYTDDIATGWFKSDFGGIESDVNNLYYANGTFFIVADDGVIVRSIDGENWQGDRVIIHSNDKRIPYDDRTLVLSINENNSHDVTPRKHGVDIMGMTYADLRDSDAIE